MMRRWNGRGDDTIDYPLPDAALHFLESRVGPGRRSPDAALADVVNVTPPSGLPPHPLVSTDAADRVRHTRGQSLPDWVAMRSGRLGAGPDGIAYPDSREEVRALLDYATEAGATIVPYGGGTSVVGHINAVSTPTLTVDLTRLNRLLRFDERGCLATFGAGITGPDHISPDEVAHLMAAVEAHYPSLRLTLDDVISTFAGVRPVIGSGKIDPSKESRDHIIRDDAGLVTVTGGKLTTFRHGAIVLGTLVGVATLAAFGFWARRRRRQRRRERCAGNDLPPGVRAALP